MTLRAELEITPLDEYFAQLVARLAGGASGVMEAARIVSAAREAGHTCLPLSAISEEPAQLAADLRASSVVGAPGTWHPLILDSADRLYLYRYWQYEHDLAAAIRSRLLEPPSPPEAAWLNATLDLLQPLVAGQAEDQRAAARAAMLARFCVITGGPGTGKTRTVALILALLFQEAAHRRQPMPRVALAAPTGKAAARLTEALQQAFSVNPLLGSLGEAPLPAAVTLHRLLGLTPPASQPRFCAANPLQADIVIIDEASMIDLAMMAKLFAAVLPEARLILLGDKDQLASVEAGHVLGDICQAAAAEPARGGGVTSFVALRKNFRFAQESGIQRLSLAVNEGDADEALARLTGPATEGVIGHPLPAPAALPGLLRERIITAYRQTLESSPTEGLRMAGAFRLLAAIRRGPYGVEHLNRLAEGALAAAGLIQPNARQYRGRPIMILQNDYNLGLFNGAVGVVLPDPEADGELRAFFAVEGGLRSIHPARLPGHETAWAMTVHKSQGSEFERVLLILPDRDHPVVTRELLYTGITRARQSAEIWFNASAVRAAIARQTVRFSGLRDALAEAG